MLSRRKIAAIALSTPSLLSACTPGSGDEASFTGVMTVDTSAEEEGEGEATSSSTSGGCEDLDGDGWTTCEGDCCDAPGAGCIDFPELVNPGAFDVAGNSVDDDCDGATDVVVAACDEGLASDSQDAEDYARAMDLCQFVEADPSNPAERRWGVVSAKLSLTDGNGTAHVQGHSIRTDFGDTIVPESESSMAVFSSGHAADANDTNPSFVSPQNGVDFGTGIGVPAPSDWLAANGGTFPNPLGCASPSSTDAHDAQMLTLELRVPTNARSFRFKFNFFSAEYPEWVCSEFNDFFVALIDSESSMYPADKNIAVYDDGTTEFPVGINLVESAQGLFTVCENGQTGCRGSLQSDYQSCTNPGELAGTGFDLDDGICPQGSMGANGGGTGWLEVAGNVQGGETMTLRLAIWDGSGHIFDSTVLVDDFEWSVDAATPGIYIP